VRRERDLSKADYGLPKREAQRTTERIGWIQAYRVYLESSTWLEKKRKVLERCRWMCEGCANRRAVEVHHKRYPRWPIMPGSEEWLRREKLWDLVGVCEVCHGEVHDERAGEEVKYLRPEQRDCRGLSVRQ
jgi:hypothetical protein